MSDDERNSSKSPGGPLSKPSSLHPVFDTSDLDDDWGTAKDGDSSGELDAARDAAGVGSSPPATAADSPPSTEVPQARAVDSAASAEVPESAAALEPEAVVAAPASDVVEPASTPGREKLAPSTPVRDTPSSTRPTVVAAQPLSPRDRVADAAPGDQQSDPIPDWAPWAVLIVLVLAGLAGFLGIFGRPPSAPATTVEADSSTKAEPALEARLSPPAERSGREAIRASHLLVQYAGSMRAASSITRTKAEAEARAREALVKAKAGTDFGTLVGEYSDEPGAGSRKGNLGKFTRKQMVAPFADAAFALKPGELSNLVETPFGYHVILRTE